MTADLFELPGDTLLARGTTDPIEQLQLTRAEEDQLNLIQGEANSVRTLAEVGLVLGAAFLLYREVVRRKTLEELGSNNIDAPVLYWLTKRNSGRFIVPWVRTVTPALEAAYTVGAVKAGGAMIPDDMVRQFATKYAVDTASYFNETSAQALTEGFNTYLNRNLPARLAAEKALQGYGLNSRMMRALVGRAARAKVDSPAQLNPDASTHDFIESMLVQRAYDIGDNEGFNVSQHGQQITWLYLQKTGRLSLDALKVWHTARDERVCPSCGPLDKQAVLVNQPFKTDHGPLWVPSMHPNCRCEVRLRSLVREEFLLSKAEPPDPQFERQHPRGQGGRFRRITRQPVYAEPEVETDVERALREAPVEEEVAIPAPVEIPTELQIPGQVSIAGPVQIPGAVSIPQEQEEISIAGPEIAQAEDQVTIPGAEVEQVVLPGLSMVQIADTVQELQVAASEQLAIRSAEAPRPATTARTGTVPLPPPLGAWRLDPSGFHYFEGDSPHVDPMNPDYAVFRPGEEFVTIDEVMEQIHNLYAEEIQRETRRIMTSGKNYMRDTGYGDIVLDEGRVQLAITAEVMGLDEPELRSYANAMGVHRSDWTVVQYRMYEAHAAGFEGDLYAHEEMDRWDVPGLYHAEENLIPMDGWPVITVDLDPEEEEIHDLPHDRT